ncbi:hypothetical protein LCGC14_1239290 [marine sediment metagenome]|uniref:HTH cro/C1-type domain-containing protein n=1 Tax=marine sediment metagenome TaxID=412755 RepID=A0A0F9LAE4_9ZZZZ
MSQDRPHVAIGSNIRAARKAMHWNQMKLAKLIGVSRQTLHSYEQAKVACPSDKLLEISRLVGKPTGWFFEESHYDLRYM